MLRSSSQRKNGRTHERLVKANIGFMECKGIVCESGKQENGVNGEKVLAWSLIACDKTLIIRVRLVHLESRNL